MEFNMTNLGSILRATRKSKQVTLKTLSQQSDVNVRTIMRIEKGQIKTIDPVLAVMDSLGLVLYIN